MATVVATLSPSEMLATCLGTEAYIEAAILATPILVSAAFFAIGQIFGEWTIQAYSSFLVCMHYTFVAINVGIGYTYPDPFCPLNEMRGGISHVTFYTISIVTLVTYYLAHKRRWPRLTLALMLIAAAIVLPGTLVWMEIRSVASVLITAAVAVFSTIAFFNITFVLNPDVQYLIRTTVLEYLHYNNAVLLLTKDQQYELELDREISDRIDAYEARPFKQ